jgi:hypothetical protein
MIASTPEVELARRVIVAYRVGWINVCIGIATYDRVRAKESTGGGIVEPDTHHHQPTQRVCAALCATKRAVGGECRARHTRRPVFGGFAVAVRACSARCVCRGGDDVPMEVIQLERDGVRVIGCRRESPIDAGQVAGPVHS